jgi:hypothetical protein
VNVTSFPPTWVYYRTMRGVAAIPRPGWGVSMEHASSHNSFNALFVLTFFASLAIVMIRFA